MAGVTLARPCRSAPAKEAAILIVPVPPRHCREQNVRAGMTIGMKKLDDRLSCDRLETIPSAVLDGDRLARSIRRS